MLPIVAKPRMDRVDSRKMQMVLGEASRMSARMQTLPVKAATGFARIQMSHDLSVTGTGSMFFRMGRCVHALDLPVRPH